MRLQHVDDRHQPALWLPDVTAWAFQRALVFDEPQWWSRVASVATIHDAATGRELSLADDRTAPPTGERGPQVQSPSAQNSLSSTSFYTLNGGTTNRTQGPGYLYNTLLTQAIEARVAPANVSLTDNLATLAANVDRLVTAIDATTPDEPGRRVSRSANGETIDLADYTLADPGGLEREQQETDFA